MGGFWAASARATLAALAVTAGLAASAQAATYTVGTTSDLEGECLEPAAGTCSLRQLIAWENFHKPPEPDAIVVPSGKYDLAHGELVIEQQLMIVGAGARTTIVDEPAGTEARVFQVEATAKGGTGIVGLEIAGGTAKGGFGGDVSNAGELFLLEDWVTGGNAAFGGGIANDAGTLALEDSLVSGNHASSNEGEGGGIGNAGAKEAKPGNLAILNSTIADNDARLGGGILSKEDSGNQITIENSTIAFNSAQAEASGPAGGPGAGLALSTEGGTAQVMGSILADNTEAAPGAGPTLTNCSALEQAKIEDPYPFGYNLDSGSDCGFKSTGDLQNTAPGFSTGELQNNGGNTDTLALAAGSPAVDAIPTSFSFCNGTDQRGVTRPQGAGCDMGAYELGGAVPPPPPPPPTPAPPTVLAASAPTVLTTTSAAFTTTVNPHGLATTVHFEYGPVLGNAKGPVTYGSVTPDQAVTPDFANHTVTATVTGLLPNVAYHVRAVATNSAGSALGADQLLNTPADPPPPPPVLGKAVNVKPVSGIVYIELPPGATLASAAAFSPLALDAAAALAPLTKGRVFVPLTEARQIPVGSTLDTTTGVVNITTATTASSKGKLQSGNFEAGIFKLLQRRQQRGLTEMDIINNHSARQVCATRGKARIAAHHLSSKVLGHLSADSHGHFTARGQFSAATVRGTIWGVFNRCDGTLTRVTHGVVVVRDFRRRKTVTLFTGQTYLAKAPGY